MLRVTAQKLVSQYIFRPSATFATGEGASFLKMVESYFDKAGIHTNIRSDKLNFYKKADNVVKCNLSIVRGKIVVNSQTMAP